MALSNEITGALDGWSLMVAKRGELKTCIAKIDQLNANLEERKSFLEKEDTVGGRLALAQIESDLDNENVKKIVLQIELDDAISSLEQIDTTDLSKDVNDAISSDVEKSME